MEIEILIQRHLEGKTVYPAFLEEPAKPQRPPRYYIVARVGVSPENHIHHGRIAVQSYAPSLVEAMALNRAAYDAMQSLPELNAVTAAGLVSDYNFTDEETGRYRWQAVYAVNYYDDTLKQIKDNR